MVQTSDHADSASSHEVLSTKAFSDLTATLSTYGSSLSPEAHQALWSVLTTMEAGLRNELPPSYYLSAIDPGTGKSLAVAMFLKAYKDAGFLPATGILVCVSRLAEVETYLAAAGLDRHEVAILTGDAPLNALGAPEELHAQAPVMFTTQQRIAARGAKSPMSCLSTFYYRGQPRALRIWDESLVLGDDATLSVDDLGALLAPLRTRKPAMAAAVQSLMLNAWQAQPLGAMMAPDVLSGPWGRLRDREAVKELVQLAGCQVRAVTLPDGLRLAGASPTIPADFAPAVILDASGRVRESYGLWSRHRGDLVRLPSASNDYRDMDLHVWKRGSGKWTLKDPTARRDIAKAVAEKVGERPGEEWLIVHYKEGGADLLDEIHGLVGPDVASRLHGLTWGRHHGTNLYAHIRNVVIIGYPNYGAHGYVAAAAAAVGDGTSPELTQEERAALQAGEVAHHLLQAVCRSSARQALNGIAGQCRVHLCISSLPGLDAILERCFPGHQRREWEPVEREELPGRNGEVVRYLARRFAEDPKVIVQKRELRDAIGLHKTVLARALNDEGVQDALDEMGVQVQHFFFARRAVSFDPLPDGGFAWDDLA